MHKSQDVLYLSRRQTLMLALAGCSGMAMAMDPTPAEANIFMPSIAEQKKLGEQAAQQILKKYREVNDSRAVRFKRIGHNLVSALSTNDQRTWNFSFHVIESKQVNAFALPGGPMFMYTGLMDRLNNNSEIAGVTGHEMAHVRLQQWAKSYANEQERNLGLSLLLGLTHASSTVQKLASVGDSLYTLHYSRHDERQADEYGLANMVAAGYNPQGMIELFMVLEKLSASNPPAFLSDHPLTSARIADVRRLIQDKYSQDLRRPMSGING